MASSSKLSIKLFLRNDASEIPSGGHRLDVDGSSSDTVRDSIASFVSKQFGLFAKRILWEDEDKDLIVLDSDSTLSEAISCKAGSSLKLFVEVSPTDSSSVLETSVAVAPEAPELSVAKLNDAPSAARKAVSRMVGAYVPPHIRSTLTEITDPGTGGAEPASSAAASSASAPRHRGRHKVASNGFSGGRKSVTLVKHLQAPLGAEAAPSEPLVKGWRVRNDGPVAWPAGSRIVMIKRSTPFTLSSADPVPALEPGACADLSVTLVAPHLAGEYETFFRLANDEVGRFGPRLPARIVVVADSSSSSAAEGEGEGDLDAEADEAAVVDDAAAVSSTDPPATAGSGSAEPEPWQVGRAVSIGRGLGLGRPFVTRLVRAGALPVHDASQTVAALRAAAALQRRGARNAGIVRKLLAQLDGGEFSGHLLVEQLLDGEDPVMASALLDSDLDDSAEPPASSQDDDDDNDDDDDLADHDDDAERERASAVDATRSAGKDADAGDDAKRGRRHARAESRGRRHGHSHGHGRRHGVHAGRAAHGRRVAASGDKTVTLHDAQAAAAASRSALVEASEARKAKAQAAKAARRMLKEAAVAVKAAQATYKAAAKAAAAADKDLRSAVIVQLRAKAVAASAKGLLTGLRTSRLAGHATPEATAATTEPASEISRASRGMAHED